MKKLTEKIIDTILCCVCVIVVIFLSYSYFSALFTMDDDLMFIYGLTLMALTSSVVLILLLSVFISSIWKKKKSKKGRKTKK